MEVAGRSPGEGNLPQVNTVFFFFGSEISVPGKCLVRRTGSVWRIKYPPPPCISYAKVPN